jgi:hypothetical protein
MQGRVAMQINNGLEGTRMRAIFRHLQGEAEEKHEVSESG